MLDFLDNMLTNQRRRRSQHQNDVIRSMAEARVLNMTERGIQFALPDTRTSTALARNAVRTSTQGRVQPGGNMFVTGSDPIGFAEIGGDTYQRLRQAGVTTGTPMSELFSLLNGDNNQRAPSSPNSPEMVPIPQARPQRNASDAALKRIEAGGTGFNDRSNPGTSMMPLTGNGYALNSGQAQPTDNYQAGYQSQVPDALNDLQLSTFVQQQSQNFQRLLHSVLFSDY